MPDAAGRFKGIAVPELPWLKKPSVQEDEKPPSGFSNRDKTPKLK